MTIKASLSRWVSLFAVIGFLVPFSFMLRYWAFGATSGRLASFLWPTSNIFMALDTPHPGPIATFEVYAIAWASNIGVYTLIGFITWPIFHLVIHSRGFRDAPSGSNVGSGPDRGDGR